MRKFQKGLRVLAPSTLLEKFRGEKVHQAPSSQKRLLPSLPEDSDATVCVVRKVGGIGDILMITPALKELKERLPNITLHFAIDRHSTRGDVYYELLKNLDFIDELVDARYFDKSDYAICVDISAVCIPFEKKGFPTRSRIDLFAYALGMQHLADKLPLLIIEEEEDSAAKAFLKSHFGSGPIIALHTASNDLKRCWPLNQMLLFIENFKKLVPGANFLVLDQNMVFDKWSRIQRVVPVYSSSVREMAALIKNSDLFVGPDSGPMHISGALKVKSVVVFGSIPPEARIGYYKTHVGVKKDNLKCIGCWYSKCDFDLKCMKELSGKTVSEIAYRHFLGETN